MKLVHFLFHTEKPLCGKKGFSEAVIFGKNTPLGPSIGEAGRYCQNQSQQASGQGGISKYSTARVAIQGNKVIRRYFQIRRRGSFTCRITPFPSEKRNIPCSYPIAHAAGMAPMVPPNRRTAGSGGQSPLQALKTNNHQFNRLGHLSFIIFPND